MKKIFKKNQIVITALAVMIAVAGYLNYSGSKLGTTDKSKEAVTTTADNDAIAENDILEISEQDILSENSATPGAETETGENDEAAMLSESEGLAENGESETSDTDAEDGTALIDIDSLDADPDDLDLADAGETPGEAVLTSTTTNIGFAAEAKVTREQVRAKNKDTLLEIINNGNIAEDQKQNAIDNMVSLTDIAEKEAAAELLLEAKGFTDVVVSITDDSADVVVNMTEVTDAGRAQIEDIIKRKTGVSAENIVITPISVEE